jgi:hypothetical protein
VAISPAGEIQSIMSLAHGNYTFEFAGNMRGSTNQTTAVSIGGQTQNITPSSNSMPYTLKTLRFTGASGQVSFTDLGLSNQQGDLLDNVSVSTGVPEPATWAMMLVGFCRSRLCRLSQSQERTCRFRRSLDGVRTNRI